MVRRVPVGGTGYRFWRRQRRFPYCTPDSRRLRVVLATVRLLPTQRALVDRFVEEAIRTTQDNRSVSRTLFEMLLPNELKEQAPDQDDIVLMLDEEAARYPWELLEDPGGTGRNPFVIEHGVLRQLETLQFRESVRPVVERNALVIGDPVSPFVELKGAQAEADAVSRSLETSGRFHVESRKRPEGDEVIQALCAMPYRVLHLAGHGVYKYLPARCPSPSEWQARGSGCPLNPNTKPTKQHTPPRQIPQMRHPEVGVHQLFPNHRTDGGARESKPKPIAANWHRVHRMAYGGRSRLGCGRRGCPDLRDGILVGCRKHSVR